MFVSMGLSGMDHLTHSGSRNRRVYFLVYLVFLFLGILVFNFVF